MCDEVGLKDTYYEPEHYPPSVSDRMVSGYFFSHDGDNALLAPLLGHDMKNDSVSWMQAAGGIVSSMQDVGRWARALYEGPLLADTQRKELMTVVSDRTGEPIDHASQEDPAAFGLGVGAGFRPALGSFWYYQGMTLGYRVLYGYFPSNGAVIVVGLNSQPDDNQNQNGRLLEEIYGILQKAGTNLARGGVDVRLGEKVVDGRDKRGHDGWDGPGARDGGVSVAPGCRAALTCGWGESRGWPGQARRMTGGMVRALVTGASASRRGADLGVVALPAGWGEPVAAVGAWRGKAEFRQAVEAGGVLLRTRTAGITGQDQAVQGRAAAGFQVRLVPHRTAL